MKKSLGRAFIFSFLVFLALNFLFLIIGYSIVELLDFQLDRVADHPTYSIFFVTYPARFFPWELLENFISTPPKILFLGGLISCAIGTIIAGLMGGDICKSFGGWIVTSISIILLFIAMITIDDFNLGILFFGDTYTEAIVQILITGIINMLIYGALVLLIALIKGKS